MSSAQLPKCTEMNFVFGCRAMRRSCCERIASNEGTFLSDSAQPGRRELGVALVLASTGSQNARGSPEYCDGHSELPRRFEDRIELGSSTGMSFPSGVGRPSPSALAILSPLAPMSCPIRTIFAMRAP